MPETTREDSERNKNTCSRSFKNVITVQKTVVSAAKKMKRGIT